MHSLRHIALSLVVLLLSFGLPAVAQEPSILEAGITITTANETTTLDRNTRRLESSLLVTVTNTGTALVEAPLHLVVGFTEANGGSLDGLNVPDALGGPGQAPYDAHYFDCSAKSGGDGLAPGESFDLTVAFDRPRNVLVSYDLRLAGFVNRPPVAASGGPYRGTAGEPVTLDASQSSDPEGGGLNFAWTLPDGTILNGPTVQASFGQPGIQQVSLAITDDRGGTTRQQIEVIILPPGDFALARTRVLDGLGHPLDGIAVSEDGPGGSTQFTLENGGFGSLGTAPGDYLWRFARDGHLTVCRRATLTAGEVGVVPNPWMQKLSTVAIPLSVINSTTIANGDAIQIDFPGGAFAQPGEAFLTPLHGQSLPGALPAGWSPLIAFHLQLPQNPSIDGTLIATLPDGVPAGPQLLLAHFDEANCEWIAEEALTPDNGTATATIGEFGSFAIVLADAAPTAPPAATIGAALPAFPTPAPTDGITAAGEIDPATTVASRVSEEVTAQATVAFAGPAALPSGTWFQADVREQYDLSDGQGIVVPNFDQSYYAYRGTGTDPNLVTAGFPVRPTLLFGPEELNVAQVHIDVLGRVTFSGGVVAPGGGVLASGPISLTLPGGALMNPATAGLRILSADDFAAFADGIVSAFALDISDLAPGTELGFAFKEPVAPDSHFLLAKLVSTGNRSGLQPVARFASDAGGVLASTEPASEPRLNGIRGPGSYLLLETPTPLALIQGRTLDESGGAFPGAAVTVVSQPWLSISNGAANYELVAAAGPGSLLARDLATGDAGTADFTVDPALTPLAIDLTIGPAGPSVIATTPAAGSENVSRVTPVTVTFSEALHPGTFDSTAVVLRLTNTGEAVPAALSLAPGNTTATLLPTNPLAYDTDFIIDVADRITDPTGLPLEGNRFFGFKTEPAPVRAAGAQLVIYEPGAQMVPQEILDDLVGYDPVANPSAVVAHGSAGTADPEVPVILVNQFNGQTATVLSKPDGSFATFIEADESDFIAATFVNANGTRIKVPAAKQLFDDGFVGLYKAGGILEAESDNGPIEVFIEPEAVPARTKFRIDPFPFAELLDLLKNTPPESGQLLGGFTYVEEGDPITSAADVSFPINLAELQLPPGTAPDELEYHLTMPREYNGTVVYELVDRMDYVENPDGSVCVVTRSPPYVGLLMRQLDQLRALIGYTDTIGQTVKAGLTQEQRNEYVNTQAGVLTVQTTSPGGAQVAGRVLSAPFANGAPVDPKDPVPGSFIRTVAVGTPVPVGQFREGEMFTTSGPDGRYAFFFNSQDAVLGRELVATNARFPFQRATGSGIGAVFAEDAIFSTNLFFEKKDLTQVNVEDTAAPVIRASHSPTLPTAGLEETDGANLTVIALDDVSIEEIAVVQQSFTSLVTGQALSTSVTRDDGSLEGSGGRFRQRFGFKVPEPGLLRLLITASDGAGQVTAMNYSIPFGGQALPPANLEDIPRLVSLVWPPNGSTSIPIFSPILIRFNVPLEEESVQNPSQWLDLGPDFAVQSLEFTPDRRQVTVHYRPATLGSAPSNLTLTLNGIVDQDPTQTGQNTEEDGEDFTGQAFQYEIGLAGRTSVELPEEIDTGGGVVLSGSFAYALDRNFSNGLDEGYILIYDLTDPLDPDLQESVPAGKEGSEFKPNDLVHIPGYAFRFPDDGPQAAQDYLAVFSREVRTEDFNESEILSLYRIEDDGGLDKEFDAQISVGLTRTVKGKWDPPFLGYQTIGAGGSSLSLLNLNATAIGATATAGEIADFPSSGTNGTDLNNDGDYADPGESAPLPANQSERVFGLSFEWAPATFGAVIQDFDFNADFGLLGAVIDRAPGNVLQLILGGSGLLDEAAARVDLGEERPKRLLFLVGQEILEGDALTVADLALVTTSNGKLIVVDITIPSAPFIRKTITLPPGSGFGGSMVPRDDGLVALAMSGGTVFLLDPTLLFTDNADGGSAAIIDAIAGTGSGIRSFVSDPAGFNIVNGAGRQNLVLTAPNIKVVTFDPEDGPNAKYPVALKGDDTGFLGKDIESYTPAELENLLNRAQPVPLARVSPLSAEDDVPNPPLPTIDPGTLHYVLVRAPGGAGECLNLAMVASKGSGRSILPASRNPVPTILLDEDAHLRSVVLSALRSIRLAADSIAESPNSAGLANALEEIYTQMLATEYPRTLRARRLSDDPAAPLFNTYLAGPVAILPEGLEPIRLELLQAQLERRYLRASPRLWVGFAPEQPEDSPVLSPYLSSLSPDFAAFDLTALLIAFATSDATGLLELLAQIEQALGKPLVQPGLSHLQPVAFNQNPVVVVPGIGGSRLITGDNALLADELWLGLGTFVDGLEQLQLNPGGSSIEAVRAGDIIRKVPESTPFGPKIYGGLIDFLKSEFGYEEYDFGGDGNALKIDRDPNWESLRDAPDLFVFPYDWRLDNATNAQNLKAYYDLIRTGRPDVEQIDIVAHSMGGLVSRRFQLDNPGLVDRYITIGTPWLGATKAVGMLHTGDFDDFALNAALGQDRLRAASRYSPAVHQLMPNEGLFELGWRPLREGSWDIDENGRTSEAYSYDQYKRVLDEILFIDPANPIANPSPKPIAEANEPFHRHADGAVYDWRNDSSGITAIHFVGIQTHGRTIGQATLDSILAPIANVPADDDISLSAPPVEFFDSDRTFPNDFPILPTPTEELDPDYFPLSSSRFRLKYNLDYLRTMGDGTVPILSAGRGFGSDGVDFNKDGALAIPIVSPGPTRDQEDQADHNGMLNNPILHEAIADVLNGRRPQPLEIDIVISPNVANEGETVEYSASLTDPPANAGPVRFLWDFGDGTGVPEGPGGTHVYADNGAYTVTCVASVDGGKRTGLTSRRIEITNADPVVSLDTFTGETEFAVGTAVTFVALPADPGRNDNHTFAWNFGDGSGAGEQVPPDFFSATHAFGEEGTFVVSVEARDNDGGSAIAEVSVTITSAAPPAPAPAPDSAPPPPPPGPPPPTPKDAVRIRIAGHEPDLGNVTIRHGGFLQSLADTLSDPFDAALDTAIDFVIRNVVAGLVDLEDEGTMSIQLFRDEREEGQLETVSTVTFNTLEAGSTPLEIRVTYVRDGVPSICYSWLAAETDAGAEAELTINWEALPLGAPTTAATLDIEGDPNVTLGVSTCRDTQGPTVDVLLDADGKLYTIDLGDITEVDGEPVFDTEPDAEVFFIEDTDRDGELRDEVAHRVTKKPPGPPGTGQPEPVTLGALAATGNPATLIARDAARNLTNFRGRRSREGEPLPVDEFAQQIERVKAAVQRAITDAFSDDRLKPFIRSIDDFWFLEQGTGACIWKGDIEKCRLAYKPGKSDNDYEIFMPVWIDPAKQVTTSNFFRLEAFLENAHTPGEMSGDWYFRRPVGFDGAGNELTAPPLTDTAAFDAYLQQVISWRYKLPDGLTNLEGKNFFFVLKGDSIFEEETKTHFFENNTVVFPADQRFAFPLTPAEVFSYVITERVIRDIAEANSLRHTLPDVSFFPFRREHFEFAEMSLEKPPPFGDDLVGDAGMGRKLLLLKWILEGAFLPQSGGINSTVPPDIRQQVFNRLVEDPGDFAVEGYEWGIYHEFAALSANVLLRAELKPGAMEPDPKMLQIFGDYFRAKDAKLLKKTGKAAIRAALARLAADPVAVSSLFKYTPEQFDAKKEFVSFENFIAEIAIQNLDLFQGFTEDDINGFLKAKLAETNPFLNTIINEGKQEEFIRRALTFVINSVQMPTAAVYLERLDDLFTVGSPGNQAELQRRLLNNNQLNYGFQTFTGNSIPGRFAMRNHVAEPYTYTYDFVFNVQNLSGTPAESVSLTFNPGGTQDPLSRSGIVVPAMGSTTVKSSDDDEPFQIRRSAAELGSAEDLVGTIMLADGLPAGDQQKNNTISFTQRGIGGLPGPDVLNVDFWLRPYLEVEGTQLDGPTPATTTLKVELVDLRPATFGQPVADASFVIEDATGTVAPFPDDGLLISNGTTISSFNFPMTVRGSPPGGDFAENSLTFTPVLRELFRTGRDPNPPERAYLDLIHQIATADPGTRYREHAIALAPSAHLFLNLLDNAVDLTGVQQLLASTENRIQFAIETDVVDGRTVEDWVFVADEPPGLPLGSWSAGTVQADPVFIQVEPWNPGRNAKLQTEQRRIRQRGFSGTIFIHRDLEIASAPPVESVRFQRVADPEVSFTALDLLKAELYHEMLARFYELKGRGDGAGNTHLDVIMRDLYPNLRPASAYFFPNPRPAIQP